MMNAFNYALQIDKEVWTKIDFRRFPQTGITNEQEYNAVGLPDSLGSFRELISSNESFPRLDI